MITTAHRDSVVFLIRYTLCVSLSPFNRTFPRSFSFSVLFFSPFLFFFLSFFFFFHSITNRVKTKRVTVCPPCTRILSRIVTGTKPNENRRPIYETQRPVKAILDGIPAGISPPPRPPSVRRNSRCIPRYSNPDSLDCDQSMRTYS